MSSISRLARRFSAAAARFASATVLAVMVAACGTGDAPGTDSATDTTGMGAAAERFQQQKALIDSLIVNAKGTDIVARELGPMYSAADDSLEAVVRRESAKTWDCYTKARADHDPNLVGVAYMLLNFGAAGWDIVRVERHDFSSFAGGVVVTCLNTRAKSEWQLPTRGVRPGAHLVRLTFRPDSAPARND